MTKRTDIDDAQLEQVAGGVDSNTGTLKDRLITNTSEQPDPSDGPYVSIQHQPTPIDPGPTAEGGSDGDSELGQG